MAEIIIALIAVSILVALSVRANRRFHRHPRLPMQFSFSGETGWTAPRKFALAFTPVIAALALAAFSLLVIFGGEPRPGQDGFGPPVALFIGVAFIAAHWLHLHLIARVIGKTE